MFHASSRKPENVYIVVEGKRSLESPPAGSTVVFDIHVGCHPDGTLVHPVNGSTTITPGEDVRTYEVRRSTDNTISVTNLEERFIHRGEGLDIFKANLSSEQRSNPHRSHLVRSSPGPDYHVQRTSDMCRQPAHSTAINIH